MNMRDNSEQVTLTRDVAAALVPVGDRIILQAGQQATITQALGGSYTVVVGGNMFRIDAKDADALGEFPVAQAAKAESATPATHDQVDQAVWEQLGTCYDPEIPVSIVELGLVYGIENVEGDVSVTMTLTSPFCPIGPLLISQIQTVVEELPDIKSCNVELVWSPPWDPKTMASDDAKDMLGIW